MSHFKVKISPLHLILKKVAATTLALLFFASSLTPTVLIEQAQARYLQTTVAPGEFKTARTNFSATLITTGNFKGQILIAGGYDGANYLSTAERFNPTTGQFTQIAGSMLVARANHAAVALPDGRIVVTGGRTSSTALTNTIEIYNPSTDRFVQINGSLAIPNMLTAREFHTTTLAPDPLDPTNSSVLVTAGGSDGTQYLKTIELFTTGTNAVESVTAQLTTARGKHAAYFFPSTGTSAKGTVLFISGTNDMTNGLPVAKGAQEFYDIQAKTIASASINLTDARIGFAHADYSTTATPNILITGGQSNATSISATTDTITHNGTNFTITPRGSMSVGRVNAMAVSAYQNAATTNKKVYVIGGQAAGSIDLFSFETYDIATNTWGAVSPNTLVTARSSAKTVVLPVTSTNGGTLNNGQIALIGGSNSTYPILSTVEFLDTNEFQSTPTDMIFPRSDFEAIEISDAQGAGTHYSNYGKILIFGGKGATGGAMGNATPLQEVEIFDPLTNRFADLCSNRNTTTGRCNNPSQELRKARQGFTANQMADGKIYIIGGTNATGMINTIEIFDPQTSTFSEVTPTIAPDRAFHQATRISNTELLITGGTNFSTAVESGSFSTHLFSSQYVGKDTSYIYNTATNTLTDKWNGVDTIGLHAQRWGHTAFLLNGKVYLYGGNATKVEAYNLATGIYTTVATLPAGTAARHFFKSFVYNNKAFIYNGIARTGVTTSISYCGTTCAPTYYEILIPSGNSTVSAIFDGTTETLSAGPTFSQALGGATHVSLANKKTLIMGSMFSEVQGNTASKYTGARRLRAGINAKLGFLFDHVTESLSPIAGDTKVAHAAHAMVAISDKLPTLNKGKVLILGGSDGTGAIASEVVTGNAELYDPENLTPDTPDDVGGFFIPQANQSFTTHQPTFNFSTQDAESDQLKYQVQIVDQALGFPMDDFEPTNEASLLWNFIQVQDQTGFSGQDGLDNKYYRSSTLATLNLANTAYFLPSGSYSMRIRAIDPVGSHNYSAWGPANTGAVVNFVINAEENAPTSNISNPLAQAYINITEIAAITGSASDTGTNASGVKKELVSVQDKATGMYWNDTNAFSSAVETYYDATGTTSWSYPRTGTIPWVSGKTYIIHGKAVDNAGNIQATPASVEFTYDTTFVPVTITLTSPTSSENVAIGTTKNINWTIGGGTVPDHYEISYSKDDFATPVVIDPNVSGALTTYAWTVPNDASTTTKLRIIAKSAAGQNLGSGTSTSTFIVSSSGGDTTAPTVTLVAPADGSNVTSLSAITGTYTDNGTVSGITISLKNLTTGKYYDGTGFTSTPEVKNPVTGVTSPWSYTTTGVPFTDGVQYEVKAYATDAAGNVGVKTITVGYNMPATNTNTNTSTGNANTNSSTGTTSGSAPTSSPTIIISNPSGGSSGFVYPIYPTTPTTSSTPQTSQSASGSASTADNTAPSTTIIYPVNGSTVQTLSTVQGTASDGNGGSGVGYILVSFYDDTTGKYFDGAKFGGTEKTEFKASGDTVWSLDVPQIFEQGHTYTIAVRGVDKSGNGQTLPTQTKVTVGPSTTAAQTAATSTTPVSDTTSTPATNGVTPEQFSEMIKTIQQSASRPQAPVNVQVTSPKTTSPTPAVSTASVGAAAPVANATLTNQNTNAANADNSYDDAYNQYIAAHPEAKVTDPAYDTMGMRDSDNDGLSDQQELKYGTDPFKRDTDGDGFSDGEEVLEYATNPLDPNDKPGLKGVTITNLNTGNTTPDQRPFITGFAKPGSTVVLYDIKPDGTKKEIGKAIADSRGRYVLTPEMELEAGKHFLASGILDSEGKVVDMSSVKTLEVDPSLEVPVPEVQDIKVMNLKPHVFGKTLYGTTVVGQFQSLVTTSSIIADTTTGDFIVAASSQLERGEHKVTLYAIMPNGVRSKSVTVPFTVGDKDTSLHQSALKADLTSAGGNVWWLIGALLPLLLLGLLIIWLLLQKKDTVVYSINKKELSAVELSKIGEAYTYTAKFPITSKDLKVEYVAFHLNKELDTTTILREFKEATQGTLVLFGKILDVRYLDSSADNAEVSQSALDTKHLDKYYVKYCFEQINVDPVALPDFIGKRYLNSAKLINDVAFVETAKA